MLPAVKQEEFLWEGLRHEVRCLNQRAEGTRHVLRRGAVDSKTHEGGRDDRQNTVYGR